MVLCQHCFLDGGAAPAREGDDQKTGSLTFGPYLEQRDWADLGALSGNLGKWEGGRGKGKERDAQPIPRIRGLRPPIDARKCTMDVGLLCSNLILAQRPPVDLRRQWYCQVQSKCRIYGIRL